MTMANPKPVIDRLAAARNISVTRPDSKALVGMHPELMLAKPQTFMNLSGTSLKPLMSNHGLTPADLILVYDELDLPWGEIRIRPKGRAGSHNGLISVVQNLGTEEFVRVRVGAHPGHPVGSASRPGGKDYLLSQFSKQQRKELDELTGFAAEAVNSIIAEGVEKSMTKFNRRAQGSTTEEE